MTWGVLTLINSYANHVAILIATRIVVGSIQAFSLTASYSIINDLFPKRLRVRVFFMFSIIISLEQTL